MEERFERNPAVEIAPMKDESVLFNPGNNKFCVLNRTAAFIWQRLERPLTPAEIAVAVVRRFENVLLTQAQRDVQSVIVELREIECLLIHQPSVSAVPGAEHEP